jgi:hypothetical protein
MSQAKNLGGREKVKENFKEWRGQFFLKISLQICENLERC